MNQETSQTDAFEVHLERGRGELSQARDSYSTLKLTDVVPDSLVEAIGDMERELDELDQTLDVTSEDVRLADQTASRASVLAEVFAALAEQQRLVVDAELARLQSFASTISDLCRTVEADFESRVGHIDRRLSMLGKLADSGRHGQVLGNDRVSPATIDTDLRDLDATLADEIADDARTTAYLTCCEKLLEDIYRTLADLDDQNPDRTAFSTDLSAVKSRTEDAEEALDADEPGRGVEQARIALEGTFMIQQLTARAEARQRVAKELAAVIEGSEGTVAPDVAQCASRGDVDALLSAIDDLVSTQVQRSAGECIHQLLREHDGRVARTVEATDFDVATVVEHLEQLYHQQDIADIEVVFER